MTPRNVVLVGDALSGLRRLPSEAVDCIVTSPPYFGLRDYGVPGQLGQEADVDAWVDGILAVCRELHRVLASHGTLWLNLGDSYSRHDRYGAPAKSLLLGPERVARGLVEAGWLVRNKVIWAKPNPMPSPIRDRLTAAHEYIYVLTKQSNYFYDLDAIRQPVDRTVRTKTKGSRTPAAALGPLAGGRDGLVTLARAGRNAHPRGKNPGDVWQIGTASYRGAHFATFPPKLLERPILSTCPLQVCTACRNPWRRQAATADEILASCDCRAPTTPGLVLDPFFGTGTVALVARQHGRDWLGIELNADYIPLAEQRLGIRIRRA